MSELVLISGSGRGLGASIAKSFIKNGYKVAIIQFIKTAKNMFSVIAADVVI